MNKARDLPREYELFKKEFTKWQKRFGCTGWKIYFETTNNDNEYASLEANLSGMVAIVKFNVNPKYIKDWRDTAKHEALHLLLSRLEGNARARHVTGGEIYESCEELVYKLTNLIQ